MAIAWAWPRFWQWPDTFDGVTVKDLLAVQHAIDGKHPRYSDQAGDDWAGCIVADVLGMDATADRKRVKRIIGNKDQERGLGEGSK